ncbi:MAG: amidohydrolase [Hyphomicrobiaceae bacterium]|nr:MAG: amidohydrolase [Hyphomicrobiaceae bacterium]
MAVADRVFVGGTIVTMDPLRPEAEALATVGKRIFAVGTRADVLKFKGAHTRVVDLDGATLLPGFVEAHGHPLLTGASWGDPVVDIRAIHTPTYEAALAKIRRRVAKAEAGEPLWFLGLDPQLHRGMREPTMADLDAIAPNNPICVQTSNFHVVYANSAAIRLASNARDIPTPKGGQIYKDKNGLPWKFQETAAKLIRAPFVRYWGEDRVAREFNAWMWHYAHSGYTSTTEIGGMPGWPLECERMIRRSKPPARLFGYEMCQLDGAASVAVDHGDDTFRVVGAKIVADGSPFAGNIWVSRPYLNTDITLRNMGLPRDHTGHMNWSAQDLETLVMAYAAKGYQIATHCQGDRAIDLVLGVYAEALARFPEARRPFRLEHCALMTEQQIDRAVSLGVVSSYFLPHIYYWGEAVRDHLFGPERAEHYMPAGSAVRRGMRVSYHTDPPMTWPNALLCLHLAVTRRSLAGNVIGAAEAVDIDTALKGVTIDAAYHIGMADKIGSLTPGKYADFVVLGCNPRTCNPEKILDIPILGTWVGGSEVWNAKMGDHKPIDFAVPVVDA